MAALVATAALATLSAGCGRGAKPLPQPTVTHGSVQPDQRDQLAGLAAAAKDKRYVATYRLVTAKRADRTVTVAVATDSSWVVAVPAGVLGGLADVAMYHSGAGTFQCALGPAVGSTVATIGPGCVAVPALASGNDPQVEHVFTDWIDALVDPATALSVASAPALPNASGTCFSVESNSAALAPPVDPGIYCYAADGVLTAAKLSFGTLTLTGPVGAAPPSVTMPGPVVVRPPLSVSAPPAAPQVTAAP